MLPWCLTLMFVDVFCCWRMNFHWTMMINFHWTMMMMMMMMMMIKGHVLFTFKNTQWQWLSDWWYFQLIASPPFQETMKIIAAQRLSNIVKPFDSHFQGVTLPETNRAHDNLIFPGQSHQNGGFVTLQECMAIVLGGCKYSSHFSDPFFSDETLPRRL